MPAGAAFSALLTTWLDGQDTYFMLDTGQQRWILWVKEKLHLPLYVLFGAYVARSPSPVDVHAELRVDSYSLWLFSADSRL